MRATLMFLLAALTPSLLWAASVTQVKGNKMMIQLDGLEVSQGSEVYALNSDGKKVALIVIKQVKGDRALGEITKGKAQPGLSVALKTAAATASTPTATPSPSEPKSRTRTKGKNVGGLVAGFGMTNMSLTVQSKTNSALKEDATLKDTSYSLKGFYDYEISKALVIRLATGLETFNAKGSTTLAICDDSTSCKVSFNYLALEGSAHYNLTDGPMKFWLGLGYSFLYAMSKSVNVPNLSSDTATNQMILLSVGMDFWTSKTAFIPVMVDYGMFPGSSNVKADGIYLRAGYGFTF